ncbi:hypothetical protein FRC02_009539, partial [Tulasnella sp. 418]
MASIRTDDTPLRQHVYSVLQDYALKHITRDYVKHTLDEGAALLSAGLHTVPLVAPGDVSMAVDPLESFLRLQASIAEPYYPDDKFTLDPAALNRLKTGLSDVRGRPISEKAWYVDDPVHYSTRSHFREEAVLSRRSIRETPALERGSAHSGAPTTLQAMMEQFHLQSFEDVPADDEDLDADRILSLRLTISSDMQRSVKELVSKVPAAFHPANGSSISAVRHSTGPSVQSFLRCNSPPYEPILRPLSPPIFPRNPSKSEGNKQNNKSNLMDYSDVKNVISGPVEVDDTQFDVPNESLILMNGWNAIITSSPTLLASRANSPPLKEEVDELWRLSLTPEEDSLSKDLFT